MFKMHLEKGLLHHRNKILANCIYQQLLWTFYTAFSENGVLGYVGLCILIQILIFRAKVNGEIQSTISK